VAQDPDQEVAVGRRAVELGARQRVRETASGLLARAPVRDDLGQHRIVEGADRRAVLHASVNPHPIGVDGEAGEPAAHGQELARRILGVEARLDRVAAQLGVDRLGWQRAALGDEELELDEVEPGHELGHRVLDLKPRVDLEEEELAALGEEELHGARADVAELSAGGDRRGAHGLAQPAVDRWRRGLLDELPSAPPARRASRARWRARRPGSPGTSPSPSRARCRRAA